MSETIDEVRRSHEFVWTVCQVLQKIGVPTIGWKISDLIKRGRRFVGRTSDK